MFSRLSRVLSGRMLVFRLVGWLVMCVVLILI